MAMNPSIVFGTLLVLCLVSSCLSQQATDRRCHAYDDSCSNCIQAPGCQWCSRFEGNRTSSMHRCYSSSDSSQACSDRVNPTNEMKIIKNIPLTEVTKEKVRAGDIVQLAPQQVAVRLRKGEPYNITFRFRLATDYPVDLYYLMDLSNSMKDDKRNLAKLGAKLGDTMKNLTTQFRLGFGSFVDKVVLPYVNTHPERIRSPCANCAPPYSFHNSLPLTDDYRQFQSSVENTQISGNVDAPEGGLDALLQAIVCWERIGWLKQARRLLVFSTDATFHHAGDGRLAGIVAPHDGQCHVDSDGRYTHFDRLDYPSIAQINAAARENQVNIIFAVSNHEKLYQSLSSRVEYSSQGMLDSESSNVVDLVVQQYNAISSEVKLTDNVESIQGSPLSVRYYSNCLNHKAPPQQTKLCKGFKEGDEAEFIVQIEVLDVPENPAHRKIELEITTFQDTLVVEVDLIAECDCEQEGAPGREPNSGRCMQNGVLQCGVCKCNDKYYGNMCQCSSISARGNDNNADDRAQCQADSATSAEVCSGQGVCECGTCICSNPSLSGKYCECNEDQCIGGGGTGAMRRLCNGRGTCDCGQCRCQAGWTGVHCECPDKMACMLPGDSVECSGNGTCSCGHCSCSSTGDVHYTGQFCEECSTCSSGKCLEFRDCVQCIVFKSGQLAGDACNNCTIRPKALTSLDNEVEAGARLCSFLDESTGCDFNFTYEYRANSQDYFIVVQRTQQCPEELDVLGVVLGVIGGVVAVGLLTLLLWKVLTTIHDRREYAKFEEEKKRAQWDAGGNPLYKEPTQTITNPAFAAN